MDTRKHIGLVALLLLLFTASGTLAAPLGPASGKPVPPANPTSSAPANSPPAAASHPADVGPYRAIKMASASDGWMVGEGGLIKRYAHGYWLDYANPSANTLEAIDANPSDAWIVGDNNTVLRLVGNTWQVIASPAPPTATLGSVSIVAPNEVWVMGQAATPLLLHYSGGNWSAGPTPPAYGPISWASPTEAWLVNGTSTAYHLSAGIWTPIALYDANNGGSAVAASVFMLGPNLGWMGLNYLYNYQSSYPTHYLSYDGQTWKAWPCANSWGGCSPAPPAPPKAISSPAGKAAPDCVELQYDTDNLLAFTTTQFYASADLTTDDCISHSETTYPLWRNLVTDNYPDVTLGNADHHIVAISGVADNDIWLLGVSSIYHWNGSSLTSAPDCTNRYVDVPAGYYVLGEIEYLTCRGIVSGTAAHTFSPDALTTRLQFAKLVTMAQGWQLTTPTTQTFTDVPPTNPLYAFVETAYAHGAINGVDAGNCAIAHAVFPCFLPNAPVTRAQAAMIVQRAFAWPFDTSGGPHFSDVPANYYAYAAIETCYHHAVINGMDGSHFAPDQGITRSQIAAILYRALTNP